MNSHMTPFDFSASSKFAKLSFSSVYPLVCSIGEDSDYLRHLEEWIAVKISGFYSRKPWEEKLVDLCKRTAPVHVVWCFPSFPCSSGDKANVRFPQPPKQKHLRQFESIPHINLDDHFSSPKLLNFSCVFLSRAKAYQLLGHPDLSKTAWITGLNLSRLDRDFFIQTKKKSDEKVTYVSQWRKEWPTFAPKLCVSID